jgi:hypothetical protein
MYASKNWYIRLLSVAILHIPLSIRAETPPAPVPLLPTDAKVAGATPRKSPEIIDPDEADSILNPNNGMASPTSETKAPGAGVTQQEIGLRERPDLPSWLSSCDFLPSGPNSTGTTDASQQLAGIFHRRPAPNCPWPMPWDQIPSKPSEPKKSDEAKKDPSRPATETPQTSQDPTIQAQTESGAYNRRTMAPNLLGDQFSSQSSASATATIATLTGQAHLTNNGNFFTTVNFQSGSQTINVPITNSNISAALGTNTNFALPQQLPAIATNPAPTNTTVTTAVSANEAAKSLLPNGSVPLQNNAVFQQYINSVFNSKYGSGAQTVFQNANLSGMAAITSLGVTGSTPTPPGSSPPATTQVLTLSANSLVYFNYSYIGNLTVPLPSQGGVVGTTKLSENNSPMPRDRVFFDYDNYSDVPLTPGGFNVERFSPGFEKTFFDGRTSVELRIPFASTLDSTSVAAGSPSRAVELGNVHVTLKGLFYSSEEFNMSTGLGIGLPTASDTVVTYADGSDLVRIKNQSVILTPFLAALYTPTDRLFSQVWAAIDFDSTGSNIYGNPNETGLTAFGRLYAQDLLQLDWQMGYWILRDTSPTSFLASLAPFVELHYNTPLNNAASVQISTFTVNGTSNRYNELNISGGLNAVFRNRVTVLAGVVLPLESGNSKFFDAQFGIRANWNFGAGSNFPSSF